MAYLNIHGLDSLWAKIKATFGGTISTETASTTVDIKMKNLASTPTTLSTATIPAATDSKAGVMTAAEHTKLSGISAGAEANVQADWNQTNTAADDYIKNKPVIPEGSTASSTVPKMDGTAATGSEVAFARGDHVHPHDTSKQDKITSSNKLAYSLISGTPNVPTDTAQLTNGAGFQNAADVSSAVSAGITNKQDKITSSNKLAYSLISGTPTIPQGTSTTPKMDGTASTGSEATFAKGDHVHPHDTSKQDVIDSAHKLSYSLISGTPTIPTNNNQLTNGAGYQNASEVQALIDAAMVGAARYKGTLSSDSQYTSLVNYKVGEYWMVATSFTHNSSTYEIGSMIICRTDCGSAFNDSDFDVIQSDIEAIPDDVINALE